MESVEPVVLAVAPFAGRLLMRRVREMFRVYPKALVGDVEAVHDLRVAARRLRLAVSLLADKPEGRRARRADRTLRDLARAAGRGRDFDVALAILEAGPARTDAASLKLRRALRSARARARTLSREALLDIDVSRLRRDLRQMVATTRVDREIIAMRCAELRLREDGAVAREIAAARSRRDPEALHNARRSARRLRYAAELSHLVGEGDPGIAGKWRRMQGRLGEIQDRRVLASWLVLRAQRATAAGDSALATVASRAHARISRDASRLAREFFADEP